jgi:hypothetical protein
MLAESISISIGYRLCTSFSHTDDSSLWRETIHPVLEEISTTSFDAVTISKIIIDQDAS